MERFATARMRKLRVFIASAGSNTPRALSDLRHQEGDDLDPIDRTSESLTGSSRL